MLSDRKILILKAVVENYSKNEKPVSSKLLSKIPYLKVSSATIRYDMFHLEEKGYLEKTHKSSGRIPSLKGYVFYLNNLITRKHKNIKIFSLFEQMIDKKSSKNEEKIIEEILKLVSELTNHVIINIQPDILKTNYVKKIDLIFISPRQTVIFIITNKGNLQHQSIFFEKDEDFNSEDLQKIIVILNNFLVNKYLNEVLEIIKSNIFKEKIIKNIKYKEQLIQFFLESFYNFLVNKTFVYGVYNFLNFYEKKISVSIKDIYEIFDKKKLINFFCDSEKVICKLANQISLIPYKQFIFLSISYNINENEKGIIAVLGINIIKYQEIIPILEYLSAHISHLYEKK